MKIEQIFLLESSLLSYETRNSTEKLELIINDKFIEYGSSGKIWNKEEILKSLPKENKTDYKIADLELIFESENFFSIRYNLFENEEISSLRTSTWEYIDGKWQIIFHQGTKINHN